MPARGRARLESNDVLMLKFRKNLAGRRDALSVSRTRSESPRSSSPRSASGPRMASGTRAVVIEQKSDHHDVDRHVERAGNGRNLCRFQPARRVDAVGDDDERTPLLALRHFLRRVRDRVPQRGRAKRARRAERRPAAFMGLGKRSELGESRVERIERGFVETWLEARHEQA